MFVDGNLSHTRAHCERAGHPFGYRICRRMAFATFDDVLAGLLSPADAQRNAAEAAVKAAEAAARGEAGAAGALLAKAEAERDAALAKVRPVK